MHTTAVLQVVKHEDVDGVHVVNALTCRLAPSELLEGQNSRFPLQVGIIMGSDSDLPTMKAAEDILKEFGVPCELTIVSAHRTPERMMTYARAAHERGLQVGTEYFHKPCKN